jgi:rRNA maturation endonuclease Nob1
MSEYDTGMMESDLKKYVEMVDLKDGKRDGRIKRIDELKRCSSCKRNVLRSSMVCAYCGEPLPLKSAFDGV